MISLKNYFVSVTENVDCIPVLHDIRFAIRDAKVPSGLVTVTLPEDGAFFHIGDKENKEVVGGPRSVSLPFQNGELVLSPRQMIFLMDTTTVAKRREYFVQVFGEAAEVKKQQRGTPPQGGQKR